MEGVSAGAGAATPPSPATTSSSPASPAAAAPAPVSDAPASLAAVAAAAAAAAGVGPEHAAPTRRRLVKASSILAKRETGAIATGPPGFGSDRTLNTSSTAGIGTGSGPAIPALGAPPSSSLTISSSFRERSGIRPVTKVSAGDTQGDYPMMSPHGQGGTAGPSKLGRPPFAPSSGIMGPLGRRPEVILQRRHDSPTAQKHAAEDIRIQQAKRACLTRAQSLGATGNYKSFDSPFGNYMVPVIPIHFFNKSPGSGAAPTSPSNSGLGVGR